MEQLLDRTYFAYLAVFASFISIFIVFLYNVRSSKRRFPPGPIGIPILGYLPFLGKEPYKVLHKLSHSYGSVFSLYLGRTYVIIISDFEAIKEAFSKSTTLDRPSHLFDFIPGGVGFSSVNGVEWFEQRRYSVRAMRDLGLGKGSWEATITDEVRDFVQSLHGLHGQPVDVCSLLTHSVANNIASHVLGRRLLPDDPRREVYMKSVDTISQFFTQAGIRNYFPWICDLLTKFGIGDFSMWKSRMMVFNEFIRKEVDDCEDLSDENNFVAGYRQEMKKQKENENTSFNETNLCGNIKALLVGGSDTTRTSINWLLITMAVHQDIQKRVQKELDSVLGIGGIASWEDRFKLPFTYSVIMESQRWKTIAPLNTSRIAQEDITLCGYDIPKGSPIIANLWGIHNDTRYWDQPEEFRPERFLNSDGTIHLKPDSYVPFSYGKRNCPGETVGMMEILIYFSTLLTNFNVVSGEPDGNPKPEGKLGLTYQAVPQLMRLIPRC